MKPCCSTLRKVPQIRCPLDDAVEDICDQRLTEWLMRLAAPQQACRWKRQWLTYMSTCCILKLILPISAAAMLNCEIIAPPISAGVKKVSTDADGITKSGPSCKMAS